jgi:CMP-N-acetylneuraminic acid synthetase
VGRISAGGGAAVINGKSILAIIPARGGSERLPDKNILPFAGKPLIVWSINAAKGSKYIDRIIVSTDDKKIADIAKKNDCNVPSLRPEELATNDASTNDIVIHILNLIQNNFDIVLILQPTSPLRESEDIDDGLEMMDRKNLPVIVSVCESGKPLNWHYTIEEDGRLKSLIIEDKFSTSQSEITKTYLPNGALFISETEFFRINKTFFTKSTSAYIMPPERSIDIDNQMDFLIGETLVNF